VDHGPAHRAAVGPPALGTAHHSVAPVPRGTPVVQLRGVSTPMASVVRADRMCQLLEPRPQCTPFDGPDPEGTRLAGWEQLPPPQVGALAGPAFSRLADGETQSPPPTRPKYSEAVIWGNSHCERGDMA
jgi:hypothetical protein